MSETDGDLKQSNFRKIIVEDDFGFSLKKLAAAGLLTFVLLFLIYKVPYAVYITYPIVFLAKFATEGVTNLIIPVYLLVLSYLLLYVFVFRKRNLPRKTHLACPYCNQSVKVFKDWQCNKCSKSQDVEKYITETCVKCGKLLDTFSCEHCHQEFLL